MIQVSWPEPVYNRMHGTEALKDFSVQHRGIYGLYFHRQGKAIGWRTAAMCQSCYALQVTRTIKITPRDLKINMFFKVLSDMNVKSLSFCHIAIRAFVFLSVVNHMFQQCGQFIKPAPHCYAFRNQKL